MQDARRSIAAALELRPDDAGAWLLQGKLAGQMRDTVLAKASFERALALDPSCEPARTGRAACESVGRRLAPSRARLVWIATGAGALTLAALLTRGAAPSSPAAVPAARPMAAKTLEPATRAGQAQPTQADDLAARVLAVLAELTRSGALPGTTKIEPEMLRNGELRLSGAATNPHAHAVVIAVARALASDVVIRDEVHVSPEATSAVTAHSPAGRHSVRRGDTLWELAKTQLGDGRRWLDIAELNGELDPHALRVGSELSLPR